MRILAAAVSTLASGTRGLSKPGALLLSKPLESFSKDRLVSGGGVAEITIISNHYQSEQAQQRPRIDDVRSCFIAQTWSPIIEMSMSCAHIEHLIEKLDKLDILAEESAIFVYLALR